jgi:hypothetical protein
MMMSDYVMPMNIDNPEKLSILNLAKGIIRLINSRSRLVFKDIPVYDP